MVERGVAERTRLMELYKQRAEDLRKQHEVVKNNLMEHKTMVIIDIMKIEEKIKKK